MKLVSKFAASIILAASAAPVLAQSAGDFMLAAGWFHIMPQDKSTPIHVTSPFNAILAGSGATVESVDTLAFSANYFVTDNWVVGLDLGVPPKYKLDGTGSLSPIGRLGTAKQWAPALLGKYFFGDANARFRPWLGLGVAHVSYTNIDLTQNFKHFIGQSFLDSTASTDVDIDTRWAAVYNAGLSYAINKNWYAALSISYLPLKARADLTTKTNGPLGTVRSNTTVTIDPIVTYLHVGYRF
jgi:outer membrane protein